MSSISCGVEKKPKAWGKAPIPQPAEKYLLYLENEKDGSTSKGSNHNQLKNIYYI
jgi:hypothetical protein